MWQIKMKETSRAAQFYQTAAEAFRKSNPTESVAYFQQAIAMLCDAGRFSTAAKVFDMACAMKSKAGRSR